MPKLLFNRPVNQRGFSKLDAIKEALFEDNVEFSRYKTQALKDFLVKILANPQKNFQWRFQILEY